MHHVSMSLGFHGPLLTLAVHDPFPLPAPWTLIRQHQNCRHGTISEGMSNSSGFWFRIQNSLDSWSKLASILPKTYQVVLEVFVFLYSNDVLWYSNPPGL